jgi:uncharacterized membrane protein YdjX (TVP38/TMEM64 family)
MDHSQIEIPDEQSVADSRPARFTLLLWLLALAQFQPVGFMVICGIVGAMFWPAGGFALGIVLGLALALWVGGKSRGIVRSPEAEQLRSGKRG